MCDKQGRNGKTQRQDIIGMRIFYLRLLQHVVIWETGKVTPDGGQEKRKSNSYFRVREEIMSEFINCAIFQCYEDRSTSDNDECVNLGSPL